MIETVYKFQTLIAGFSALAAAAFTTAFLWRQSRAIAEEGKRERTFRTNQHKIEMQTKRRAVAVMLEADIRSGMQPEELEKIAKAIKEQAERLAHINDREPYPLPIFPPAYKSYLSNYSNYVENMPLMRVKTVQEVSRLYSIAKMLPEVMEISNSKMEGGAKMEGLAINKTRAGFLSNVSSSAEAAKTQIEKTLPLLEEEIEKAEIELDRLNGVKEKPDTSAP